MMGSSVKDTENAQHIYARRLEDRLNTGETVTRKASSMQYGDLCRHEPICRALHLQQCKTMQSNVKVCNMAGIAATLRILSGSTSAYRM